VAKDEQDLEIIEGEIEIGSQYHFYMETLACIVRPSNHDKKVLNSSELKNLSFLVEDDQYEVHCTTQWIHLAQTFIASVLNIQKNKLDMKVIYDHLELSVRIVNTSYKNKRFDVLAEVMVEKLFQVF